MDGITALNNMLVLEKFEAMVNSPKNAKAVKAGALCLGVKGQRLVIVENKFSVITKIVNFFKRISTSQDKIHAVHLDSIKNKQLLETVNKISLAVPSSEAGKLADYKKFANNGWDKAAEIDLALKDAMKIIEKKEKELFDAKAQQGIVPALQGKVAQVQADGVVATGKNIGNAALNVGKSALGMLSNVGKTIAGVFVNIE